MTTAAPILMLARRLWPWPRGENLKTLPLEVVRFTVLAADKVVAFTPPLTVNVGCPKTGTE